MENRQIEFRYVLYRRAEIHPYLSDLRMQLQAAHHYPNPNPKSYKLLVCA